MIFHKSDLYPRSNPLWWRRRWSYRSWGSEAAKLGWTHDLGWDIGRETIIGIFTANFHRDNKDTVIWGFPRLPHSVPFIAMYAWEDLRGCCTCHTISVVLVRLQSWDTSTFLDMQSSSFLTTETIFLQMGSSWSIKWHWPKKTSENTFIWPCIWHKFPCSGWESGLWCCTPKCKSWPFYAITTQHWAGYLASPCLHFPVCEKA